jgi:anti-sigma B factor antagonist
MLTVTQQSGVTVLCTGPSYTGLEYQALQEFGEVLLSEVARAEPPRFVIDMAQTDFIGSSFIELMVRAWKRIKNREGAMVLCTVHPYCQEVLRVSRLDSVWPMYATREEAVKAI